MGLFKEKRPVLFPKGMQVGTGGSTFTGLVNLSGSAAGIRLNASTLNVTAAAQVLSSRVAVHFITVGTSGAGRDFILPNPVRGDVKMIFVDNQSTSVDTVIHTAATASVFWGTTYNTCALSAAATGNPGGVPGGAPALMLVGASTNSWAMLPGTTHSWDLSATTGSTATA